MKENSDSNKSKAIGSPSSTRQGNDSRDRILDEAKKLFRQKGFEGVSINDIVDMVGVKKPTIYYYFGDKEGLFVEVLVTMMRHGHDFVSANIRSGMSTADKLEKLSEGYLRFSPTSLMSMIRDAQNYLSVASQQTVREAYDFYLLKPFERLFQEGIQAQEIRALDPREMAMMYLGLIDAVTTQKSMLEGRMFNHKAAAGLLVNMMFDGIRTI
jgi:AcrR family transcriptional regulator